MSYSPTSSESDVSDSFYLPIPIPPPPILSHASAGATSTTTPPGDPFNEMTLELMREAMGRIRPDPVKDLYNDTRPFDMYKLPLELQEEILGYLDLTSNTRVLARLCLVNKTFKSRFTPLLYSNLDFIRQNRFRGDNKLLSDLICTLASKENDNAAMVKGIRVFDDLRNSFSKVDGGTLAIVCSMFRKNQLKEICIDVGSTSLSDLTGAFRNESASKILLNQNAVERVDWSLANNLIEGIYKDDPARISLFKDIAATPRTSLTSLNVYNFVDPDSIHGLGAYLKSAVNLRELGFGVASSKCDILYEDEGLDGVFYDNSESENEGDGEDNNEIDGEESDYEPSDDDLWDLDEEFTHGEISSVTHALFKFINRRCNFAGHLTSLKLEKVPLHRKKATPGLVASTFRMDALQKLVLLDCWGLPRFLEKLSPPDMKSLKTLHLEYRKQWAEAVETFLDNLPPGTLSDLGLLQWGGGLTLPTDAGAWPDIQAAHLVSLVLDARPDIPPTDPESSVPYEPSRRKQETSIPIDQSNDPFFLRELFSRMVNLEELGISCSIDTLTAATHKSPFLRETPMPLGYHPTSYFNIPENNGASGESSRTAAGRRNREDNRATALKSPFLSWLSRSSFGGGSILPRLRVFQMRNLRTWDDILPREESRFHTNPNWSSSATNATNRIQADVEHIYSSILPQASAFIFGCKRPTQFYHATKPNEGIASASNAILTLRHDRTLLSAGSSVHVMADELLKLSTKGEREAWLEANFPALYITSKGVMVSRLPRTGGSSIEKVCRVLPTMDQFAWDRQYLRIGSGHVKEGFLLPRTWKEFGSKVYEVAWSR